MMGWQVSIWGLLAGFFVNCCRQLLRSSETVKVIVVLEIERLVF